MTLAVPRFVDPTLAMSDHVDARHHDGGVTWLLLEVEDRAVLVHAPYWRRGVPVCPVVFRGDNPLDDPIVRPRPMAADTESSIASIRVLDSKNCVPVGRLWADKVVIYWKLKVIEFPAHKSRHPVRASSRRHACARAAAKCFPGSSAGNGIGLPAARGRDEGPGTGEPDLQAARVLRRCECHSACGDGIGDRESEIDDVPPNVLGLTVYDTETNCRHQ